MNEWVVGIFLCFTILKDKMESSNLLSLREQAALPPIMRTKASEQGTCLFNVDGRCISGGEKVSGARGYRLASLGYPMEQAAAEGGGGGFCAAFPLFAASNRQYELFSYQLATSGNPLKAAVPFL